MAILRRRPQGKEHLASTDRNNISHLAASWTRVEVSSLPGSCRLLEVLMTAAECGELKVVGNSEGGGRTE